MKIRDILRIFDKLEMEVREGRDTLAFFRWQGRTILWTKVPHKRGELKGKLPHFVRQQLRLNERQSATSIKQSINEGVYPCLKPPSASASSAAAAFTRWRG